ncbi:MAG: hypothetical protein JW795_23710, partial [Chitinivibrionales bacterium]|nr:hypothetical protein [Chitinivibrionales bacterium]
IQRAWSQQPNDLQKDAILFEWQPHIVTQAGIEILRGGDGSLVADKVLINGTRIDPGEIIIGGQTAVPPSEYPDLTMPSFRIKGRNPVGGAATIDSIINALVQEYYSANSAVARVSMLSLDCWQQTCRRIISHESGYPHGRGGQFENRGTGRRKFDGLFYGHEQDMPLFGAPHGYGFGQLDNPPVSHDAAWSYIENLKESIRRIMDDKATAAYNHIRGHLPTPLDQRIKAVYQREIVRRYNGGTEFQWLGNAWKIYPSNFLRWKDQNNHSLGRSDRLPYPNNVIGTAVVYSTGSGAATQFPWPIVFNQNDFGPGT